MTSPPPEVLVVGAGVSGLTTAVRLAETAGVRVRIRAERESAESTSAAAGAIWDPIYATHPSVPIWAERTYDAFVRMERERRPGVQLVDGVEASREAMPTPEWALPLPGYRDCTADELPTGFESGWHYRAPIIDMPPYLDWLLQRFQAAGGEVARGRLESLEEAFGDAPVVVNCSGVGARELVPDIEVRPIRGQLVAVENPGITEFFAEHTDALSEMTYLIPQGPVLLLGGSADKGVDSTDPDETVAHAIVDRCAAIFPSIATARFLGHRAGIRPDRPTIRFEHENLGDRHIVHNYGHSGAGVSLSWGCADDVAKLVLGLLR
jgi:D-amino-acid oxidase